MGLFKKKNYKYMGLAQERNSGSATELIWGEKKFRLSNICPTHAIRKHTRNSETGMPTPKYLTNFCRKLKGNKEIGAEEGTFAVPPLDPSLEKTRNKGSCPFILCQRSETRVFVVVYEKSCSSKGARTMAINRSGSRAPVPMNTLPYLTRTTK